MEALNFMRRFFCLNEPLCFELARKREKNEIELRVPFLRPLTGQVISQAPCVRLFVRICSKLYNNGVGWLVACVFFQNPAPFFHCCRTDGQAGKSISKVEPICFMSVILNLRRPQICFHDES